MVWGSDGDQAPLIQQTEPWDAALAWDTESYRSTEGEASWPTLRMEGNPVFKWASYTMAKTAAEALDAAGVRPEDLDVFAHQANMRITDAMFRAETAEPGRRRTRHRATGQYLRRIDSAGHRGLLESGEAHSGQTCLIIGFGAGLVYAGQVIILP